MRPSISLLTLVALALFIGAWIAIDVIRSTWGLQVNRISFNAGLLNENRIKILFLSDLHLTNSSDDFERLDRIVFEAEKFEPDLILLGGDHTGADSAETTLIRDEILAGLSGFIRIAPTYSVLGNHEWWTSMHWAAWLESAGINVIENKTESIEVRGSRLCLRGLGDAYTDHYRSVEVPNGCGSFILTLTHDPAAIEQEEVPGLYLAGHTHCGQIRLPFIHPNWAPTSASPRYVCDVGQSDNKVWLTTSGVGTSVIPLRFGAPAAIELISIE